MSKQLFDVVFFGILQAGKDKEMVMQNMATLFKTEASKLAPYFAGGRKVLKSKIDAETADKYRAALENVGLVIKLEACETEHGEPDNETAAEDTTQQAQGPAARQTADGPVSKPQSNSPSDTVPTDPTGITIAPVGADVIENPVTVVAQKIDDISGISMAEVGADVLENPVEIPPQEIADFSTITIAEPGSDVLENPVEVIAQEIDDISDISMAEVGADIIENPKPVATADIPDISELSLHHNADDNDAADKKTD